jgi:hypothetical protein
MAFIFLFSPSFVLIITGKKNQRIGNEISYPHYPPYFFSVESGT